MLLSVKELHQQTDFGDVHKEKQKKFDHLILGPAAGEGLPDRLQCQGFMNSTTLKINLLASLFLNVHMSIVRTEIYRK